MKHLIAVLLVLLSLPFLNAQVLLAQSDFAQGVSRSDDNNSYRSALVNIGKLRTGTLIVRLNDYEEKLEFLKQKGKTEKAKTEKTKIDFINQALVNDFIAHYRFSDVVFCYGRDIEDFLDGKTTGIFLNENLENDPAITVKEGPLYIFGSQSNDHYYIYTENFEKMNKPAPYVVDGLAARKYIQIALDKYAERFRTTLLVSRSVSSFNNTLHFLSN